MVVATNAKYELERTRNESLKPSIREPSGIFCIIPGSRFTYNPYQKISPKYTFPLWILAVEFEHFTEIIEQFTLRSLFHPGHFYSTTPVY